MKFLLVLAVVLVAFWVWRNNRLNDHPNDREQARSRAPRAPQPPTAMVACAQCGMHLPETEAVPGRRGVYCCHEHRRQREEAGG